MEILVKRTPGAEFFAAQLFIRGGVRDWTEASAGVEYVTLQVATSGGTKSLPKGDLSRKLASLGATLGGGADYDLARISTKAPLASWDELFPIFVEAFLAPALPETEFDIVKQRELTSRKHEMEDGDGRLQVLVQHTAIAGHPYAKRPDGTVETISALKASDLAPQLGKLRDSNRLVLVVVGDLDPARVIDQAKTAFASIPRGPYVETPMPSLQFAAPRVASDTFTLPTNYIESVFAGPGWNDPDFPAMRLAMDLLNDRVFDEVRTKRNLSYAPNAYFQFWQAAPYSRLYVTAVDPNAAMKVMFEQKERLRIELIPAKELDGTKAVFLSLHMQHNEAVNDQATELGYSLLLGGDWHMTKAFADRIRQTTPEDIRRVATKWLTTPQTAIVGDPSKLDPKVVGVSGPHSGR